MKSSIGIRFATIADERLILDFLSRHWKRDHIFVTNPELLRWQHRTENASENRLNFVIAEGTRHFEGSPLVGLLGFIPFKRFAPAITWTELALAIWKVRDDCQAPGVGLRLLKYLERELTPALICAIGISEIVKPIYEALGYQTSTLYHGAVFGSQSEGQPKIARGVPKSARLAIPNFNSVTLHPINADELLDPAIMANIDSLGHRILPRKSCDYIRNRYLNHPWYSYQFRLACDSDRPIAILVWRKVFAENSSILRIVDVIGDADILYKCGERLREEIESAGCEYIDLLCHGLRPSLLRDGGFVDPDAHENLVLPNYFSPFERRNIKISVAYKRLKELESMKVCLFRGDSDQDRPNSPSELINVKRTQ